MKNIIGIILLITFLGIVAVMVYKQKQYQSTIVPYQNQTSNTSQGISPTQGAEIQKKVNVSQGLALEISQPTDGLVISLPQFTVKGKTSAFAIVSVNDSELKADASGNFSTLLTLDEGENTIVIVANDSAGNYAEKELTVTYNAPTTQ